MRGGSRAYTDLGSTAVMNWAFTDADRYLKAGIAYSTDRGLDTWRLYVTAWLARPLAEQGRYDLAGRHAAGVLRHPHRSPITRVSALPVAGVLAGKCGRDGTAALDEALPIATATGKAQPLVPVAAWSTRPTPRRPPQCTGRRTVSSPTRPTRSPRELDAHRLLGRAPGDGKIELDQPGSKRFHA